MASCIANESGTYRITFLHPTKKNKDTGRHYHPTINLGRVTLQEGNRIRDLITAHVSDYPSMRLSRERLLTLPDYVRERLFDMGLTTVDVAYPPAQQVA